MSTIAVGVSALFVVAVAGIAFGWIQHGNFAHRYRTEQRQVTELARVGAGRYPSRPSVHAQRADEWDTPWDTHPRVAPGWRLVPADQAHLPGWSGPVYVYVIAPTGAAGEWELPVIEGEVVHELPRGWST